MTPEQLAMTETMSRAIGPGVILFAVVQYAEALRKETARERWAEAVERTSESTLVAIIQFRGFVCCAIGLAILAFHPYVYFDGIFITLIGVLTLLLGSYFLLAPRYVLKKLSERLVGAYGSLQNDIEGGWMNKFVVPLVLLFNGFNLTWRGWGPVISELFSKGGPS